MEASELKQLKDELGAQFSAVLEAALAKLELSLVDRLTAQLKDKADSAVVDELVKKVQSLEESRAAREALPGDVEALEDRVTLLERFRYAVPGVSVLSLAVSVLVLIYYVTH